MRFGSLFTGIGGFDLGLGRAGMACAWQCEIDPQCREVLARRFPGVPCYEDVKEVHIERGSVDLVCGGFPCQDLSVAGRRAGLAGERSGLWHEFHRVLEETRPEWCVIENVPGLLSSNRGNDFAVVLRGLVELGYGVCWRVLDAQHFGVAQRRRRVFAVGHLGSGRAAQVLFEPESVCGNPPPRRTEGQDPAGTLGGGSGSRGWADDTDRMTFVAGTLSANGDGDGAPLVVHALTAETVRRLTPTECERLQGFPDGWTDGHADGPRYRMLGNAVAVPVAEWIGRRIVEAG